MYTPDDTVDPLPIERLAQLQSMIELVRDEYVKTVLDISKSNYSVGGTSHLIKAFDVLNEGAMYLNIAYSRAEQSHLLVQEGIRYANLQKTQGTSTEVRH